MLQAQETFTLDDMTRAAEQWAQENLDEDFLRSLNEADQRKVQELLRDIQKQFHGEYIIDLAQLRDAARGIVPLLESYEETTPLAEWLKARLDYLDVANELRLLISPPVKPGEKPKPFSPPPSKVREIWIKEFIKRPVPENAKPYVPRLKSIFQEEKVPPELVWVAEVESGFDARARSPAGAAGLFQLMPRTAKKYGLRTWPLDQRYKPETSAHAAAQYLQRLQSKYHDWRLALAAYNAGEGTVDALLARYKTRSFDTIARHLPAETQLYVPKVEATVLKREGMKLAQLSSQ